MDTEEPTMTTPGKLIITSPAFSEGEEIPIIYTSLSDESSPELRNEALPERTQSLAVLMEDVGARWFEAGVYWLVWNIRPTTKIPKRIESGYRIPILGLANQAGNHRGRGYAGPYRTDRDHLYRWTVYALDARVHVRWPFTRKHFCQAIAGHVLAQGSLQGRFGKNR